MWDSIAYTKGDHLGGVWLHWYKVSRDDCERMPINAESLDSLVVVSDKRGQPGSHLLQHQH